MSHWRGMAALCVVMLAAALSGCGGGAVGQQKQQPNDSGRAADNTALSPGTNDGKAAGSKGESAGPTLPQVRDVAFRGDYALALVPDLLVVISLQDPAQPKVLARQVLARTPLRLALDGLYAYAACGQGGLQIVNLSQINAPQLVGTYAPANGSVTDVAVHNGQAVAVVNGKQLAVLNVREPTAVTEQKLITLDSAPHDLLLQGDRAYCVGKTLSIINLAKPTEAAVVGHFEIKENLRAVAAYGALTALWADQYLHLLDLSVPERPVRAAELSAAGLKVAFGETGAKAVATTDGASAPATATVDTPVASSGANGAPLMRDAGEVTAQPKPAESAKPAPDKKTATDKKGKAAAKPAPPPAPPVRLVSAGDQLYLLREGTIYVLKLDDQRKLAAAGKIAGLTAPSALAVADKQVLVGLASGELQFWAPGDKGYQKTATLDLAAQVSPAPKPAEANLPAPPTSAASQQAMQNAPQPSGQPPAGAPKP